MVRNSYRGWTKGAIFDFCERDQTSVNRLVADAEPVQNELVGERGFEPPTPWSRNSWEALSLLLTAILEGAPTVQALLIFARFAHSAMNWSPRWSPNMLLLSSSRKGAGEHRDTKAA